MGWVATLLSALLVVVGYTVQNVTIVYWTQADISNFAILILCGVSFFLLFGSALLAFAFFTGDWDALYPSDEPAERSLFASPYLPDGRVQLTHAQILFCVGLLNSLNGYGIVYASPPTRTPPLVQAILQNAAVVWSVPFSKMALGDKKRYAAWEPVRAACIILASVAVSLAPTILGNVGRGGGFGASSVGWIGVYLVGLAFGAAYNVMQQLYFIRCGVLEPGTTPLAAARAALRALFYANVAQPVCMAALVWLDLLPWFGTSTSLPSFSDNTLFSLACSVGGPALSGAAGYAGGAGGGWDCPARTPIWAWAFILGYLVSYWGSAQLNRESATFSMLVFVVITMATAAFWLIPGTNPNPSSTPLWSVLTSLALSLAGSYLWKQWESRTPPEEQFAVGRSEGRALQHPQDGGAALSATLLSGGLGGGGGAVGRRGPWGGAAAGAAAKRGGAGGAADEEDGYAYLRGKGAKRDAELRGSLLGSQ